MEAKQAEMELIPEEIACEKERLLTPNSDKYSIQEDEEVMVPDVDEEDGQSFYLWEVQTRTLPPGKSSAFGAVFIIVNAALGAGLLAFPFAFHNAGGWVNGLIIQLILLVFIIAALQILAYVAEQKQTSTYEDTVSVIWGPVVRVAAEVCVILYTFGANVTYLVVIGDQISDITPNFHFHNHSLASEWWVDRKFTIAVSSIFLILPWLWLRRIGVLSYTSFLAVLSCIYIAGVVTVRYFTASDSYFNNCPLQPDVIPSSCLRSWPDALNAIPYICFGYQCHVSSVPVYAGLKRRNLNFYVVIIAASIAICFFVYTFTGTFGLITFSSRRCLNSDILRNYCPSDIPIDIARVVLAFVMITSYPILAFCGRTALDSILMKFFRLCRLAHRVEMYEGTRLRVEATVWFFISLVLAIFVPQISYVISPIGGLAATFIFVFPGLCLLKLSLDSEKLSTGRKAVLVLISAIFIVIGSFIFGNSVANTILQDTGVIK